MNIGAQLYTVRRKFQTNEEIRLAVRRIKEIGYQSVQLFGSVELIKNCVEACKMEEVGIVGILADLPACESNEKELLEICRENNIPDLGISSSPEEYADPWAYIERVNAFARKAAKAGITFSYHNHGHEFVKITEDKTAMELFLEGFDKECVSFMPDTYWVHDGGYDVRYFLEQTGPRIKILHLKDLKRTEESHFFAEVGNGNLYMEGILKTAQNCGVKNFVVEQDECDGDPFESLTISFRNLMKILEG